MPFSIRNFSARRRAGLVTAAAAVASLYASCAAAADHPWLDKKLLAAAKKEGALNVYSSTNEREGLPLWKIFEDATGIKVTYVRASDTKLMARIAIETRAGKEVWDVLQTTTLNKIPQSMLRPFDPSEAKHIPAYAKDKNKRWYGVYANYNTPAYNTKLVKASDLPKTYEDFAKHPEWKGKVAIDFSDEEWLKAMYEYYGAKKGEQVVNSIIKTLQPVVTKGHLAMARSVGAGEYAIALNNYTNLTLNVRLAGGPTDFWVMDPVAVFYGQAGVNPKAPHPNAALLGANFLLSREAQAHLAKFGRIPTREDVPTNPPDTLQRFKGKKIIPVLMDSKEGHQWSKRFRKMFEGR